MKGQSGVGILNDSISSTENSSDNDTTESTMNRHFHHHHQQQQPYKDMDSNKRNSNNDKNNQLLPSLETVRMRSLLDTENSHHSKDSSGSSTHVHSSNTCSNNNNKGRPPIGFNSLSQKMKRQGSSSSICNKYNNKNGTEKYQNQISNSSPSSVEVTFSDPHQTDHSSFSRRQSTVGNLLVTSIANNDDNDNVVDEEVYDEYVRSGTHFRSLLDSAFRKVVNISSDNDENYDDDDGDDGRGGSDSSLDVFQNGIHQNHTHAKKRALAQDAMGNDSNTRSFRRRKAREDENKINDDSGKKKFTAQLAREKMSEVLALQRVSIFFIFLRHSKDKL